MSHLTPTKRGDDAAELAASLPAQTPDHVRRALAEAKQRLQQTYGDRLSRIILYGSRARGDATEESDVDLLIVLDDPIENRYQEIKRAGAFWGEFLTRYGLSFSVKPYSQAAYEDPRRPLMQNVREEGIQLL